MGSVNQNLGQSDFQMNLSVTSIIIRESDILMRHLLYLVSLKIDRAGKNMTVVPVKENKDYGWREDILNECLSNIENDTTPFVEVNKNLNIFFQ